MLEVNVVVEVYLGVTRGWAIYEDTWASFDHLLAALNDLHEAGFETRLAVMGPCGTYLGHDGK